MEDRRNTDKVILERLNDLSQQVGQLQALAETVAAHGHTLHGNGRPGLVAEVAVLKDSLAGVKGGLSTRSVREWGIVVALALFVLNVIADHFAK